jgi:bifunctional non-homologous end joining protein LigD
LKDRPLVLTRFPEGIHGKSFFQKDAPTFVPEWIRLQRIWSENPGREISYFIVDDVDALLYVANLATIPLHLWSSRVASLQTPDWSIIDLDPKGAPRADVVTLARAFHTLCEDIGLPSLIKTSGQQGLHVLIPLGGQVTHEQSRSLAELLCRVVLEKHTDIASMLRDVPARQGKVYLDYLQNGHGRLLVSPFCVRPVPGAPVSMPLLWEEVNGELDPSAFSVRTAVQRMEKLGEDPLLPLLSLRPHLPQVLERLSRRVVPADSNR